MKEQDIQRAIGKEIEKRGGYVVKVIQAAKAGVPDLVCCYRGQFVAMEVKTPTGRVSRLQVYNLEKILRAGGYGAVVRSVDDARALLDKIILMDLPERSAVEMLEMLSGEKVK